MEAERLRRLLELLKAGPDDAASDPCAALAREAMAEAMIEAKARLRELFVQVILQVVLDGCPIAAAEVAAADDETLSREETSADEETTPHQRKDPLSPRVEPFSDAPQPPAEAPSDDRKQLLSEIEAIRRQLAENEERLRGARTPPPGEAALSTETVADTTEPVANGVEALAYYVYGFVPATADPPCDAWPTAGIDPDYPVISLSYQELQAAISQVSLGEFGEEGLTTRLEDLTWVEDKARRHQEVLEALMRHGPLIPLRFCTLCSAPERVQEMLAQRYEHWVQLLDALRDKQEWGVKVHLADETLAQKVDEVSPMVQQLKAEIAQRSSGAAYFAKKKLDGAVAEEVERLSDEYAQDSHDRLTRCAAEARINLLQRQETTSADNRMVLNGAYLVDETQWPVFRAEIAALEEQYGPLGLTYTLTGPWPPYSFVRDSEEGCQ